MRYQEPKISAILFCFIIFFSLQAQNDVPIHSIDEENMTEWLLLGPFSPNDLDEDFLSEVGGEAAADPKEGDIVVNKQGDSLTWQRIQSNQQIVDLLYYIGNYQNATAYAFCKIQSPLDGSNKILLGSDDGMALWINGKRIHFNPAARHLFIDQDVVQADLKKGENRCLVKISQGLGNWGFAIRVLSDEKTVIPAPKIFLSSHDLENGIDLSNRFWKYHSGDNDEWSDLQFDDHTWNFANPGIDAYYQVQNGWQGTGWFRLHIVVDSTYINKPLGLSIWQAGTSKIYINGELISYSIKESEKPTGHPIMFTFDKRKHHVIALRYSNQTVNKFNAAGYSAGFYLRLQEANQISESGRRREMTFTGFQIFFTTLPLAIGLLHMILFSFFPALRQNLYFALFLFAYAATIYFDYEILLSKDVGMNLSALRIHSAMIPLWVIFQLRFVYSLFYDKVPKQFWIIALVSVALGALVVYKPAPYFDKFGILYGIIYVEITRVISLAVYKKREGAWIIGSAFLVFFLFGILDALMDMGILISLREIENPYAFGAIGFFVAMSIYLSRDFARTNRKIADQEMEQKLLEAENQRQAKELEEARQLQLSMLPKVLPKHPQYDLGVYMKTATEVGGDYYDFKLHEDGTLTIVIGDATGHGMQAGTMVAATKSLFNALSEEPEPVVFLKKGSDAIKAMGLKKMYMALTIAKFKDQQMQLSAAGMPYPLIYRSSSSEIEEVTLKGMPLGGFVNFPYQEKEIKFHKGDTVLFMSDGFEEMFNPQDEQLGAEQVKEIFKATATMKPDDIVAHLKSAGEKWANGRDQEDDVTFVVVKIK